MGCFLMENFLSSNNKLIFADLDSRVVSLCEDAKKIVTFTLNPTDEFESVDGVYYYALQDKKIPFRLLSDGKVTDYDKKILLSKKREDYETSRSLRIAASHNLANAVYMVVISNLPKSLVRYVKEGIEYIIDYDNNLVMQHDDYKEIFPYEIIEEIDQANLSYCSELIEKLGDVIPINLILLGFSEIMDNLRKNIPTFAPERYMSGIHWRNRYIIALDNELLFSTYSERKDIGVIDDDDVIFNFTLNPLAKRYDISISEDNYYLYKGYRFRRISDCLNVGKFKEKLVSSERFHMCMAGSIWMSLILAKTYKPEDIRIVLGVIPQNDYEGNYHAWTELRKNGKWIAVDYTGNLIMESDDYIRLRDAKVLRTIEYLVIKKLGDFYYDSRLEMDIFPILYFAEEMLRDIKKSVVLSKKT